MGQSEYEVAAMVDFFLVLMLPNAGDELQGIKRGIMELADTLVINKADGESLGLAQRAQQHYQNAMHLIRHSSYWSPKVLTCSAMKNEGVTEVWNTICEYKAASIESQAFEQKRAQQNSEWMNKLIHEMLELRLSQNPNIQNLLPTLKAAVIDRQTTPYNAAKQIVDLL